MSNPKDSPVIDSTVVKKGAVATASKTVTTPKTEDKDNSAHYDSIAELKKATDIVDAVGKPVQETAESDQAAKKAKLKDQLISEAKELEQNTAVEIVNKAAKSSAADTDKDSQTTDTVDADKKASAKPDSNSNDEKQLKKLAIVKKSRNQQRKQSRNQNKKTIASNKKLPLLIVLQLSVLLMKVLRIKVLLLKALPLRKALQKWSQASIV